MRPNGPSPGSGGAWAGSRERGRLRCTPGGLGPTRCGAARTISAAGQVTQVDASSTGELRADAARRESAAHRGERWQSLTPAARAFSSREGRPGPSCPLPPSRRGTACSARRGRVGARREVHPTPRAQVAWPAVGRIRPVLKHGPRSAAGARVSGWRKPPRAQ